MLAIGLLSMILAATSSVPLHAIDARPRLSLDLQRFGPTAQLLNGSILAASARSLQIVEKSGGTVSNSDQIVVSRLGDTFIFSIRTQSNREVSAVQISSDGRSLSNAAASATGQSVASVPVPYVRSFEALQKYYQAPGLLPKYVVDRDLANYDALIFRQGNTYHVDIVHHPSGMHRYLGCFDGSGYSANYIVDATTLRVAPGRTAC